MSRHILCGWTKGPLLALLFIISAWGWMWFEERQGEIFPVVEDFQVLDIQRDSDSLYISGTMRKVRDCSFERLTVYDKAVRPMRVLDYIYLDTPNSVQSRDKGVQAWGVWKITPNTKNILLTAIHTCSTGLVKTTLYDGAI